MGSGCCWWNWSEGLGSDGGDYSWVVCYATKGCFVVKMGMVRMRGGKGQLKGVVLPRYILNVNTSSGTAIRYGGGYDLHQRPFWLTMCMSTIKFTWSTEKSQANVPKRITGEGLHGTGNPHVSGTGDPRVPAPPRPPPPPLLAVVRWVCERRRWCRHCLVRPGRWCRWRPWAW